MEGAGRRTRLSDIRLVIVKPILNIFTFQSLRDKTMSKASMRFETAMEFLSGDGCDLKQALSWLEKTFESVESMNEVNEFAKQIADNGDVAPAFREKFEALASAFQMSAIEEMTGNEDYAAAEPILLKLAEEGNADAQYNLALLYMDADEPIQSTEKFVEWIQQAAKNGSKKALDFITKEVAQTEKWAKQGNAMAMCMVAREYLTGKTLLGLPHELNTLKAMELFEQAYEAGEAAGAKELSRMYKEGLGIKADPVKAHKWMLKAAEHGDCTAEIIVAMNYLLGDGTSVDKITAVKWFKKAANQGSREAMSRVGDAFKYGWGVEKDEIQAVLWYEKAIAPQTHDSEQEEDEPPNNALRGLAELLLKGEGSERDVTRGLGLLKVAAENGDPKSQCTLGNMLISPEDGGLPNDIQNEKEGLSWIRKSADQSFSIAEFCLAAIYVQGWLGVEKDLVKAKEFFERAIEHGGLPKEMEDKAKSALRQLGNIVVAEDADYPGMDMTASKEDQAEFRKLWDAAKSGRADDIYALASAFYIGSSGAAENEKLSAEWFRKSAELGNVEAMTDLAEQLEYGRGGEKNVTEALKWYVKAAELGDLVAQRRLARRYAEGEIVEKDLAEALKYYKMCAEQHYDEDSIFEVGKAYYYGRGVEKDNDEAFKWLLRAAEQGRADAQTLVGKCYKNGWGGAETNDETAFSWYVKSAKAGDIDAICAVGWAYQLGRGVGQDFEKAVEWFKKGADKGDAVCMNNLACLIEDGKGAKQNYAQAFELFENASKNGCDRSFYHLGRFYENGSEVNVDLAKAKEMYQKAADAGDEDAKAALERLH